MAFKIPPIKGVQDSVRRAMMDTDRRLAELEGRRPEAHVTRDGQTLIVGRSNLHWEIAGTDDPLTTVIRSSDGVYGISGVWLDATGRFSLGAGLKVDQFGQVEISGEIRASELTLVNNAGDDAAKLYTDYSTIDANVGATEDALVFAPLNGVGQIRSRLSWNEAGYIWMYTSPDGAAGNWDGRVVVSPDGVWATRNRTAEQGHAGFQSVYQDGVNWARLFNIDHANTDVYTQVAAIDDAALVEASNSTGTVLASRVQAKQNGEIELYATDTIHLYGANGVRMPWGNAAAPGIHFDQDPDTGLYRNRTNEFTATAGGTWVCTFKSDGLNLNTKNITGVSTLRVNEIHADLGGSGDPSYTFNSYKTTGIYGGSGGWYGSVNGLQMFANTGGRVYVYASADNGTTPNNAMWTSLGSDLSWGRLETAQGKFYINKEIWVDEGKVSSYNEDLQLLDAGKVMSSMGSQDNRNGNTISYAYNNNGSGTTSGHRILTYTASSIAGGGTAGTLWQTTYSTDRHVHARVYYTGGDVLGFRNYENTLWAGLKASAFTIGSDLAYKKRVRKGRDEHHPYLEAVLTGDRQLAFDNHRGVETIIFDNSDMETLYEWDGCPGQVPKRKNDHENNVVDVRPTPDPIFHATRDECTAAACEGMDNMIRMDHHCDDYECGGTNERPCWLIEKHVDRPGFSAQNVEEFFPKTVDTDFNGEERGIDIYGLVAELWNTVDHLIEECEDLRAAIVDGPGPDAKPRPRGGTILPKEPRRIGKRVTK